MYKQTVIGTLTCTYSVLQGVLFAIIETDVCWEVLFRSNDVILKDANRFKRFNCLLSRTLINSKYSNSNNNFHCAEAEMLNLSSDISSEDRKEGQESLDKTVC